MTVLRLTIFAHTVVFILTLACHEKPRTDGASHGSLTQRGNVCILKVRKIIKIRKQQRVLLAKRFGSVVSWLCNLRQTTATIFTAAAKGLNNREHKEMLSE